MKKIVLLLCVFLMLSIFAGCAESKITDPMKLILGTWNISRSVDGDGEIYEGDDNKKEIITFYPDGLVDFDGTEGIWILLNDCLTICDGSDEEVYYIRSLTENELSLTEAYYSDGGYIVCERMQWGDLKYTVPADCTKNIVGRWSEPDDLGWYMQFYADGTGIYDGDGYDSFTWSILNGNRLRISYSWGVETMVIREGNENSMTFVDVDYDELRMIRVY